MYDSSPWGVITGRLVDDHGKPIGKALVLNAVFRPAVRPEHGVFPERPYLTDKAGTFQIEGLAPGIAYDIWMTSTPGDVSTIAAPPIPQSLFTRLNQAIASEWGLTGTHQSDYCRTLKTRLNET